MLKAPLMFIVIKLLFDLTHHMYNVTFCAQVILLMWMETREEPRSKEKSVLHYLFSPSWLRSAVLHFHWWYKRNDDDYTLLLMWSLSSELIALSDSIRLFLRSPHFMYDWHEMFFLMFHIYFISKRNTSQESLSPSSVIYAHILHNFPLSRCVYKYSFWTTRPKYSKEGCLY